MPLKSKFLTYELGRRLGYQGPRIGVQPPAPCEKLAKGNTNTNILQLNIAGLQNKTTELVRVLHEHQVHVALLQETILPKKEINISGYTQYRCECSKCQGIMTLVRNNVQATVTNITVDDIDHQEIKLWGIDNTKYTLHNMYCPPASVASLPDFESTQKRTIVAGDFNAHLPTLGYRQFNNRGLEVEEMCNTTNLMLLQKLDTPPTLYHRAHGTTSRPDLTFVSAEMADNVTIKVLDDVGSDHRPILITITKAQASRKSQAKPSWNFKKANWNRYSQDTDVGLDSLIRSDDINTTYNNICTIILEAARRCIPRGKRRRYKPYWSPDLAEAVRMRREARKKAEQHPTTENRTDYNRLTAKVRYISKKNKRETWRKTCSKMDMNREGNKAWRLLHSLEGSKKKTNPTPLEVSSAKIITANYKKANAFNNFFASVNKTQQRKTLDKILLSTTLKSKTGESRIAAFNDPFGPQELKVAIRKLRNNKTPGPDQIKNEMIRKLGPKAKETLLWFVNRTWKEGQLPSAWLTATIIPVLKKGKPSGSPESYRPISLTSCLGKLVEKMVNNRLYWWLESNNLLDNNQAGFRRKCRTDDPLFRFTQNVVDGFQEKKSTVGVFIDFQQAYDRVWRKGLLLKMRRMEIGGKMIKWIQAFLTNRTITTRYEGTTSRKRTLEEGLPQGSSLSCTLFLIYINDLTKHLSVSKSLFADDLVIWTTDKYPILAKAKLNRALLIISAYCELWKLKINTHKTVYATFSRSHKTANRTLNIRLHGETLTKEEFPVYLGVKLDSQLKLDAHVKKLREKASRRLNLIKRLASTTWGADKHTLRHLYLSYVRSVMDYNLPLQTMASTSTISSLDRVQNQGLRLICGGMRSTPVAACEIATNIEPLDIRRKRSLVETVERYRRQGKDHPNRLMIDTWKQTRRLKQRSLLDLAKEETDHHYLPQEREIESKLSGPPPWENFHQPTIKTKLLDKSVNRSSLPTILKTCGLETIYSYPASVIQTYTDGSAFKATSFAGYGIFIKYPDGVSFEFCDSCGENCTNYEAEIIAIRTSIELLHQQFELLEQKICDVVIFSDALSVLETLKNLPYDSKEISLLGIAIHNLMSSYSISVTLQWIPGHSGLLGNERADRLAKAGAAVQQRDRPCSMRTVQQILRNNTREDWLNRWAQGTTGRTIFKEMPQPKNNDTINGLCRKNQSLIFQFRTGHARVNGHLNRINPQHAPLCRHCSHPYETTDHLLFECPVLSDVREKLLQQSPTVTNSLYGTLEQLQRTCTFIRMALGCQE